MLAETLYQTYSLSLYIYLYKDNPFQLIDDNSLNMKIGHVSPQSIYVTSVPN
jgi:hypothetical protein